MVVGERNSDLSQIAVNTNNIPDDSVDCGVRVLGWCRGPTCQKYARLRTFIIVLAFAGILQGACESYFRISAKEAAFENGYNPLIIDWLLVSSGIFQAVFALAFAHWAFKLHPISWLSGVIMLQGAACVIAMIPSIMNFSDGVVVAREVLDTTTCQNTLMQRSMLSVEQSQMLILILLFVLQLALGLGSLVYYVIGITYIDDNSQSIDSAAVIGTAFGAKMFGLQVGTLLMLGVNFSPIGWWLGWVILAPLILVSGVLLGLFPKHLPKTVIHQAAQRIIEESRIRNVFGSQFSTYIDDVGFGPSLKRVFSNKLLMCNIMGIMFIQSATVNYLLQEENYLQSRFFLPFSEQNGLKQEWEARFVAYFLRPPVAAIGMLIGGLVISKLKLSGRKITGINIAIGIHLLAIYIGYIFIKCDVGPIAGITSGKLQQPYCSRQCICEATAFQPVCPENSTVTYFSPCYAGCKSLTSINSVQLYEGCSCNAQMNSQLNTRATNGACSAEVCSKMLILFQVLSISAAGILGASTIGKIIITLRSVLPQDKAIALGMETMFFGLFAYVPVHLAYDVVTRTTCLFWTAEYSSCLLRETPRHGNILNIITASLILVGILFDILVFIFIKGLNIYNCKVTDVNYTPSLYSPIPHEDRDQTHNAQPAGVAMGGSPVTTMTTASSPAETRATTQQSRPTRPAPNPAVNIFRNPSSLTNSSAGESNVIDPHTGVTYAQVVFPPDKHKTDDGTTSPKRMIPRADVPVHHLSAHDVRTQLNNLKSFHSSDNNNLESKSSIPLTATTNAAAATPTNATATRTIPMETDLDDDVRPQSPETAF